MAECDGLCGLIDTVDGFWYWICTEVGAAEGGREEERGQLRLGLSRAGEQADVRQDTERFV